MAILDNADLLTLAIKGDLIGSSIHLEDGSIQEVLDFEIAMATDQICIKTASGNMFLMLREKFTVTTVNTIARVNSGKTMKHKK